MQSLFEIRVWDGSQHRAWEELAYQLRDPTPPSVVETRKTRAPDGGVEWYLVFEDGHHEGYQAKFYADLASAIGDMRRSVESVAANRLEMTKLTFVVPFDFTDHASSKYTSDQDRWDTVVARWRQEIPGADRLDFAVVRGGDVLDRLAREEHVGRRAFWFGEVALSWEWLHRRWEEARWIAGERYTPDAHTPVDLEADVAAAGLTQDYLSELEAVVSAAVDEVIESAPPWSPHREEILSEVPKLRGALDKLIAAAPLFDPSGVGSAAAAASARLAALLPEAENDKSREYACYRLRSALSRLGSVTYFLRSDHTRAAATGVMAIVGPAGQGKTHLVLQTAANLLSTGTPALVLMGQRFANGPWWVSMRDQLGISVSDADQFFGAFAAMAQAAGRRGVIFIDALNESQDSRSWRSELPSLLDRAAQFPWLASCSAHGVRWAWMAGIRVV